VLPFRNCTIPARAAPLLCVVRFAVSVTVVPTADAGALSVHVVCALVTLIVFVEELWL
jgi:hypothetical protein